VKPAVRLGLALANGRPCTPRAAAGVHLGRIIPQEAPVFVDSGGVTILLVADHVTAGERLVQRERIRRRNQRIAALRRQWRRTVLGTILWPIVSCFGWVTVE
jgi:hypothetical protein